MNIEDYTTKTRLEDFALEDSILQPAPISIYSAKLPKTTLRYAKCGNGPPLIILPATISRIKDWSSMIEAMGTKFTAYFFELPGHGGSSAYEENFSSDLVSETVKSFADFLGLGNFSLMSFSFGGILAYKTIAQLENRIDRVILIAPCLSYKALKMSFNAFRIRD